MKQVKIDLGLRPSILKLGEAERGRLFKAILDFSTTGEYDEPCGNEKYVWESLKESIASQRESFTHRSKVNATNRTNRKESLGIVTNRKESFDKEKESNKEKEIACVIDPNTNNSIDINNKYINKQELTRMNKQELNHMFDIFWEAYPRKVGKKKAKTKWDIIQPSRELLDTMLSAIEAWRKTDQWGRGYVPNPETWLNQERWNDRVPERAVELPRRERERMNGLADMERRMREREAREAAEEALAKGGNV